MLGNEFIAKQADRYIFCRDRSANKILKNYCKKRNNFIELMAKSRAIFLHLFHSIKKGHRRIQ